MRNIESNGLANIALWLELDGRRDLAIGARRLAGMMYDDNIPLTTVLEGIEALYEDIYGFSTHRNVYKSNILKLRLYIAKWQNDNSIKWHEVV